MEAYQAYHVQVLEHHKRFVRYANDFLDCHLDIDASDAATRNRHHCNWHILHELFSRPYQTLLLSYFNRSNFTTNDVYQLMHTFDTTEPDYDEPDRETTDGISEGSNCASTDFGYSFNEAQLRTLHHYISQNHLFRHQPTYEEICALFTCTLTYPLQAENNRHVIHLFQALYQHQFIHRTWQSTIATHRLISSSTDGTPLTARALAAALYEISKVKNYDGYLTANQQLGALCDQLFAQSQD
jgi:hypothetical protein